MIKALRISLCLTALLAPIACSATKPASQSDSPSLRAPAPEPTFDAAPALVPPPDATVLHALDFLPQALELATGPLIATPFSHWNPQELFEAASSVAIVRVVQELDECSNAGGHHYALEVLKLLHGPPSAAAVQHVRMGAHAWYGTVDAKGVYLAAFVVDGVFVDEDHDLNPDSSLAGWCLDLRIPAQGLALGLVPLGSEAEAMRAFEKSARQ